MVKLITRIKGTVLAGIYLFSMVQYTRVTAVEVSKVVTVGKYTV